MGNFKRNNRFSGRGSSGGFASRSSGRPEMHKATCGKCGKDCEVPFKPSDDRPVFCNDCFRAKGGAEPRRFRERDSGRFGSGDKKMYEVVCDKCGKDCEVPFKPTSSKPIYCNQCFDRGDKNKSFDKGSKQLETINTKLDEILKLLNPVVSEEKKEKKVKKQKERTKVAKSKKTSKSKKKKTASPKKIKAKKKK